jgi:hypothetical protein
MVPAALIAAQDWLVQPPPAIPLHVPVTPPPANAPPPPPISVSPPPSWKLAPIVADQAADRPPTALTELRGAAIAAYTPARTSDWPAATEQVRAIQTALESLPAHAGRADLTLQLSGHVQGLRDAIRDHQAAAAATNANWIARIADEMSAAYETRVPADVRLLAFFGRAIEIDAMQQQRQQAKSDVADLRTVWNRVESMVLRQNGIDEAKQFTDSVAQLDGALESGDLGNAARAEIAAADRVVTLLRSAPAVS